MIKLPKNWKNKIQLRDWTPQVNEFSETCILIFAIRNTDGLWSIEKVIKINRMDNIDKNKALEDAYKRFLYEIPSAAAFQEHAIRFENGEEIVVPITDNKHWEIIEMVDLQFYKPKKG